MKVIIAGSRIITDFQLLSRCVAESGWTDQIIEVVSGGARGVDKQGEMWARKHEIPIKRFPAMWDLYGKAAGPIRNKEMAEYADALIALLYGRSTGTANMIKTAGKVGLLTKVFNV